MSTPDQPTLESLCAKLSDEINRADDARSAAATAMSAQRFALQEAMSTTADLIRMGREKPTVEPTPRIPTIGDKVKIVCVDSYFCDSTGRVENVGKQEGKPYLSVAIDGYPTGLEGNWFPASDCELIAVLAPRLMAEAVDTSEDPALTRRVELPPHYYDPRDEAPEPTPLERFEDGQRVKCIERGGWPGKTGTVVFVGVSRKSADIKLDGGMLVHSLTPYTWVLTSSPGARPSLALSSADEPFSEAEKAQLDRVFRGSADKHAGRNGAVGFAHRDGWVS